MNRRGFASIIILLVTAGLLVIGGIAYYFSQRSTVNQPPVNQPQATSTQTQASSTMLVSSTLSVVTTTALESSSSQMVSMTTAKTHQATSVIISPGQTNISWADVSKLIQECRVVGAFYMYACGGSEVQISVKNGPGLRVIDPPGSGVLMDTFRSVSSTCGVIPMSTGIDECVLFNYQTGNKLAYVGSELPSSAIITWQEDGSKFALTNVARGYATLNYNSEPAGPKTLNVITLQVEISGRQPTIRQVITDGRGGRYMVAPDFIQSAASTSAIENMSFLENIADNAFTFSVGVSSPTSFTVMLNSSGGLNLLR